MHPSRKIQRTLPNEASIAVATEGHATLEFWTDHPTKPSSISLTEFATGNSSKHPQWSGDFSGRPELINELAPHIYVIHRLSPEQSCINLINTLRFWWRLFDEYEALAPVKTVIDINQIHEAAQIRKNAAVGRTNLFLALVNARRLELGLGRLFWIKREESGVQKDLVTHQQIKLVYEELKQRAWKSLDKIKLSHALNGNSRINQLGQSASDSDKWSYPDRVATHRWAIAQIGHPCPAQRQMRRVSYTLGEWNTAIIEDIYFTLDDMQALFFLTVLLTGWNAETVLNIDVDADPIIPHPTSSGFMLLRSVKTRGNTEQIAICQAKRELAPTNLVAEIIRVTRPLREYLRKQLSELPLDADRSRRSELERSARSVWLYPVRNGVIRRLVMSDATRTLQADDGHKLDYLPRLAASLNRNISDPKQRIPVSLSSRNLRDAFISFAYANNGYSWLIAKLAAGHSDLNTTRTYLAKTHWARFGRSKVRKLTEALWREIGERRIVEPAFLYAMVQQGEITEVQRQRWLEHKDRTRIGVGCKDFKHPPKTLVPEHKEDTGCRAFRCTLCPHAVVFEDSLDHLARRKAELVWARENIPLVSWEQSIFPEELGSLEEVLQLFPSDKVDARLFVWKRKIECGEHSPRLQEGEYA